MKKENKVTLNKMRDDVTDIIKEMENEELAEKVKSLVPMVYPLSSKNAIENGDRIFTIWCPKCGNEFSISNDRLIRKSALACPCCGNKGNVDMVRQKIYFLEGSDSDYARFIVFDMRYDSEYGSTDVEGVASAHFAGAFTPELGIRFMSSFSPKLMQASSSAVQARSFFSDFKRAECVQPEMKKVKEYILFEQNERPYAAPASKKHGCGKKEAAILSLPLTPAGDIEALTKGHICFVKTSVDSFITEAYLYCDASNETYSVKTEMLSEENASLYRRKYSVSCPGCGEDMVFEHYQFANIGSSRVCRDKLWYDVCEGADGTRYLVQRVFSCEYTADKDTKAVSRTFEETERIYYDEKKKYIFLKEKVEGADEYVLKRSIKNAKTFELMQSDEEIVQEILDSSLSRTGYAEAVQKGIANVSCISADGYMDAYYADPRIEQVCKAGFDRMTRDMMRGDHLPCANEGATSLRDMLGITKSEYKALKSLDPCMNDYLYFHRMRALDPALTKEQYEACARLNCDVIMQIMEYGNLSTGEALDYIKRCQDYQCIMPAETISLWRDYLRMASDMHYDLDDKSRLMPSSLKLAHDKATFAYRVVENELQAEKFRKRAEKMKSLEYKNKEYGLMVVAPKEAEDVVQEGTNQKHCVASYVNAVANGETSIVFIRKIDEPEKSFYTVEVKNGAIRQLRGYCNACADKHTKEFVQKWAAAKQLAIAV